jgi:cytochrome c oxidase cbb3-type subunit I/II
MPRYPWLVKNDLDISNTTGKVNAMVKLGVPYTQFDLDKAVYLLQSQAKEVENNLRQDPEFVKNYGSANIQDKEIVALIAYLQRLGTDINAESAE